MDLYNVSTGKLSWIDCDDCSLEKGDTLSDIFKLHFKKDHDQVWDCLKAMQPVSFARTVNRDSYVYDCLILIKSSR